MRFLLLLTLSLTFVGCGTTFRVNATRFHEFQTNTEEAFNLKKTFNVVPYDKKQKGSLAFESKAKIVSEKLEQYGMKREKNSPQLLVFLGYSIDGGVTKSGVVPTYGQTGGGSTSFSGSTYGSGGFNNFSGTAYSAPTYGVTGYQSYSRTEFTRNMSIKIVDIEKSTDDEIKSVFEAQTRSVGSSGIIDEVVPFMIEAIFQDFPGPNGKTTKHDISKKSLEQKE